MSNLNEALSKKHRLSVWHVYHKGEEHISITPFLIPEKEHGYSKKHDKGNHSFVNRANGSNSYFVHRPSLLFHQTPRTLRCGDQKSGDLICIIKRGTVWRNWVIQFGDNLKNVIDPRGVVKWECRTNPNNYTRNNDQVLKGYKVRSWRIRGESGREYHRQVNVRRKAVKEEEKANRTNHKDEGKDFKGETPNMKDSYSQPPSYTDSPPPCEPRPAVADEAFRLSWTSPFSVNTRKYSFSYAGIEFFWEGTRNMHSAYKWARKLMPFNHLKLIAKIPGVAEEKIFVAQYTSSFGPRKYGELWVFDSAVSDLLERTGHPAEWAKRTEGNGVFSLDGMWDIRQTRLYSLIMATAMCMVIGERQKRLTLWLLFLTVSLGFNASNSF
jgi:hypothetical protein